MGTFSTASILYDNVEKHALSGGDIIHDIDRDLDWSISLWFKTSNTTSQQTFLGKAADWSGYPHGWQLRLYPPGHIMIWMLYTWSPSNQLRAQTSSDWADGDWHHLAFTHDTSISGGGKLADCKCYIDGVLQPLNGTVPTAAIDTLANNVDGTYEFRIGDAVVNFLTFDGNIDEVAIYKSKVLSQAEIDWIYGDGATLPGNPRDLQDAAAPSGLHAWWRMGENATARTSTNAGTVDEQTAGAAASYSPLTKSILLNDGVTNQHVEFPSVAPADFDFADPFSFGIWVKAKMPPYDPYPVAPRTDVLFIKHRTGGTDSGYAISVDYRSVVPASPQLIFKASIETATPGIWWSFQPGWWANTYFRHKSWWDGVWHLILVTWNGTDALVWVDGQRRTESQTTSDPYGGDPPADGKLFIGNHDTGSAEECPDTNVCHAFIYDKTLTAAEVRAVYGEGVPQDLSTVGPTANLVFWSALGDGDAIGASNVLDLSGNLNHGTFVNGASDDFVSDVPSVKRVLTRGGKDSWWNPASTAGDIPAVSTDAPFAGPTFDSYYEDPANTPLHTWQQDTFPQYEYDSTHEDPGNIPTHTWLQTSEFEPTLWYRMRGVDITCPAIQQPAYVFWTVPNTPDWNASKLTAGELICGTDPSTDVDDITIAGEWVEEPP